MFKILSIIISFIGVSIIMASFLFKSPEVQNSLEFVNVKEVITENTVSVGTSTKKIISKLVIRESPLPAKIELPLSAKALAKEDAVKTLPPPPSASTTSILEVEAPPPARKLLPLDEEALLKAIVKIQCPTSDGLGKYIGSGFVVGGHTVVTAAHVIKDSASDTCEVIFPRERRPIHYLRGTIANLKETIRRHDEEGIDVGILVLPEVSSYPEARAIFSNPAGTGRASYPSIPYPICNNSRMLGDKLLHFGYPSNFLDQTYLSETSGEAVVHAEIKGIENRISLDGTYSYKSPIFEFTYDESKMHPYMVSRVASFYGDSGGLAFDADKQCIIGPHRGGTIGKGAGENYSVFMNLGWEKARILVP